METVRNRMIKNKEYAIEAIKGDIIMSITETICKELNNQNINLKQFAKKLGKTDNYVVALLNGNKDIKLSELAKIAFVLDLRFEIHGKEGV